MAKGTFRPFAWAGDPGFAVAVTNDELAETRLPAAGDTYNELRIYEAPRTAEWRNYVFAYWTEEGAPEGGVLLIYLKQLPTTAQTVQRVDDLWGVVTDHTYIALAADDIPDRADTYAGANVLDVTSQVLGGGALRVKVTTTPLTQVTRASERHDTETGETVDDTQTFYLTATKPTGTDTDTAGQYRVVEAVKHHLYVKTARKSITLPIGYANAKVWITNERGVYWPPVLKSLRYTDIKDSADEAVVKVIVTACIRKEYTGHCRVTNKEWWQHAAPGLGGVIFNPTEMNGTDMFYKGVKLSVDIPSCLHGAYTFTEHNLFGDDPDYETYGLRVTFPATNLTDWPGSVIGSFEATPRDGGYHCRLKDHARPFAVYQADGMTFTKYA